MYVTLPVKAFESEITYQPNTLNDLANVNSQEMNFEPEESLFFEGDDADYIYEVVEGVVRSSKVLMDGRRQVLNFCYPGEMIGISHDRRYHCDCDAVSRVKVRLYRRNTSHGDVAKDPEFYARLLKNAAAEVNSMQEHFLMLGRKTAMEKLASFLVAVMNRQEHRRGQPIELELPMKRSDIADFLGMTIETVSRNLTKLRKLKVIELPNTHTVRICRAEELRSLAENAD